MNKGLSIVILAGGIGKRFYPFVTDKSMFPFLDEPIIITNIRKFVRAGFTRFVIVTNDTNDKAIRSLRLPEAMIETVVQKNPGGMADAVMSASPHVLGGPMLVVNAEDVVDESLYTSLASRIRKKQPFVVGRVVHDYFDLGYLVLASDRLVNIVEKPGRGNEPSNLVNLVFHYFPYADNFIDYIKRAKTTRDDLYEQALNLFTKAFPVSVISYDGVWSPLKYPWHTLDMMRAMLATLKPGKGTHVDIRNNVILEGPVRIGNNVKVFENTKIVGPTYIGDNTIIGSNNIIRESMIGQHCVTGFNTDIARSYIGDNCWFHSNYIGDSVLEGNVGVGAGTVLANFRLDEGEIQSSIVGDRVNTNRNKLGAMIARDVRIGVNTSIMPGVKIGTNSLIGAGLVIDQDVPEHSFCMGKQPFEIKKNTRKVTSQRAA